MRHCVILSLTAALAGLWSPVLAEPPAGPSWVVEPLPAEVAELLADGYPLLGPDGRSPATVEPPVEEIVVEDRRIAQPARPIVDGQRRLLGYAGREQIWPILDTGGLGEPFPTIRAWQVQGHRVAARTLFARWGHPDPGPFGQDTRPPVPGFTVYDHTGRVVMREPQRHFVGLLDDGVLAWNPRADARAPGESDYWIVGLDGTTRASISGEGLRLLDRSGRYVLFRHVEGEPPFEDDAPRQWVLRVYRSDGRRVVQMRSEETPDALWTWTFFGDHLVAVRRLPAWRMEHVILDLRSGERRVAALDLPGEYIGHTRAAQFDGGEWLLVHELRRLQTMNGWDREEWLVVPVVLDVESTTIVWTGEGRLVQEGHRGERLGGRPAISKNILRVPGQADALLLHAPVQIRRVAPQSPAPESNAAPSAARGDSG